VALPETADDLIAAAAHYQSWRLDGKAHFLKKYEDAVGLIASAPDSFSLALGPIQKAILKQSYYIIYFLQEPERCLIIAVLDGRRNPNRMRKIVAWRKMFRAQRRQRSARQAPV